MRKHLHQREDTLQELTRNLVHLYDLQILAQLP